MKKNYVTSYSKYAWGFLMMYMIVWSLFIAIPFISSIFLSFQSCTGSVCTFTGLGNFQKLLNDPIFWAALKNTMFFLVFQVPILLMLALICASILNNPKLRFKGVYRTMIFLPAVTSLVAYSVIFKMLFSTDGLINKALIDLHLIAQPIPWLSDPLLAKFVIIIALIWRWTGYNMIFYISAMQNIPYEIYEAARVEGANSIIVFFKITLPQLKPIIFFTMIMSTIGTLQLFDEVVNITAGGPGYATTTLSQYIYYVSFIGDIDFGYAAAISYAIVIIVVILSLIQKKAIGE